MKEISFRADILPLKDRLFRLALRITRSREEAEDVVQDTLLRMWTDREKWADIGSIENYSLTVCRNLALDVLRHHERRNCSLDEMASRVQSGQATYDRPDNSPMADEVMIMQERMHMVRMAIDGLPEKQRTAIQLRDIEGKSYKDIAEVMNISEADVKVTIFRGRRNLASLGVKSIDKAISH